MSYSPRLPQVATVSRCQGVEVSRYEDSRQEVRWLKTAARSLPAFVAVWRRACAAPVEPCQPVACDLQPRAVTMVTAKHSLLRLTREDTALTTATTEATGRGGYHGDGKGRR